ncbi:phosphoribosyl-anthranilate isomerase [Kluyveromyces marxianus]|uniref:N-(5'-phosphoribosyl)anthranilate isomerase n=1 Tax=Kluyveromyces marxianus TaxID=4911 RepID=A4Z4U7_KLUMA|nr:phosphoribosyl-anthranilate isomerase [Kluyveromyces marxianus]BAP72873.1 phosphoribosyl-anthranilate isomerase [Kluyveromyces marxianus]
MLVKICGLQSVEAAQTALDRGADLLGVICVPNRKRTVTPATAKQISQLVHQGNHSQGNHQARLVGVFRNQPLEEVLALYHEYNLDVIQLHGNEDVVQWRKWIPKDITLIKAFQFPGDCDVVTSPAVAQLQLENVLVLFDSGEGGTGQQLDWNGMASWCQNQGNTTRFILAGGLTPDNVRHAITSLAPHAIGVDVSGGVETNGHKDMAKIAAFISQARGLSI